MEQLAPFFTKVQGKLNEILLRVTTLENRIGRMEAQQVAGQAAAAAATPTQPPPPALPVRDYPLKDKEELVELDHSLGDQATRDRAVSIYHFLFDSHEKM